MRPFLAIIILTLFLGCKTDYKKSIDTHPNGEKKVKKSTYPIIEFYDNGQVSFQATVVDNKFVGVKTSYFENGNLKEVDSLLHPCDLDYCDCDGKISKYYSNGQLQQTFESKNGVANGQVILYARDSSGKIRSISDYKNDKKNGVTKTFYRSGKIYKVGTFANDTLIDHIYYFEETGDTMKIMYTWYGQEDFPTKKWLTNGQIFYATYLDSTYKKALYRWTDKSGIELRREIVSPGTGGKWITANGKWLTPN